MDPNHTSEPSAQQAAPVEQPGAQHDLDTAESSFEGVDDDALMAALDGDTDDTPPAEEPEATETPTVEPAAPVAETTEPESPAASEEPQVEPNADDDSGAPKSIRKRLSVRGIPAEQQVLAAEAINLVRDGKATDIPAAIAQLSGQPAEPSTDEDTAPAPKPEAKPEPASQSTPDQGVVEVQNRIAKLSEELEQATEDYDIAAVSRLNSQLADEKINLFRAEQAAQVASQEAETYEQNYEAALDRVEARYPDVANEGTAFYRLLQAQVDAAEAKGDPMIADPTFVERLADQTAADLGIKGAVAKPPTPAHKPVGSLVAPGSSTAARPSPAELRKALEEMSIEELEDAVCVE